MRAIRRLGFRVTRKPAPPRSPAPAALRSAGPGSRPADSGYHDYAELSNTACSWRPRTRRSPVASASGARYEGRDVWAVKISDNPAVDEAEPEVLFDCGRHAREHLTIEMCLYLLNELTGKYGSDSRITTSSTRARS